MIIQALMTPRIDVHWVSPNDTLQKALSDLESLGFTALPVLHNGRFMGVISRRVIFESFFKGEEPSKIQFLCSNIVQDFLVASVPMAHDSDLLDEVIYKFLDSRYDFLPVLADDRFLGIVTRNNVLNAFITSAGLGKTAHRLAIVVGDFREGLLRLFSLIAEQGAEILGLVTFAPLSMDVRFVEVTVGTDAPQELAEILHRGGFSTKEARMARH